MKYPVLLAIAVLLLSSPAWATDGVIDGVLHDKMGNPLANTQVKLQEQQDKKENIVKTTTSDAAGHYAFSAVSAGNYIVLVTQNDAVLGSATISVKDAGAVHQNIALTDNLVVDIIAARQRARNDLSPKTGTSAYEMNEQAIASLPQGEDTPVDKILLQMPGVAEDSAASGLLHIRGEHANVQYRLNGILLPEGILGLGDTLDTHIIQSATLLDGVLPAQYGFRTAGVVDIVTKTGFENGGTASFMGGSNDTFQESVNYAGTVGNADYFASATHFSSDLGIENPTKSATAIHDHTDQNKEFAYAAYMINPMQELEIAAGNSISYFQIPNNPDQATAGYQLNGTTNFNSADLNERQFESNQFVTAAWEGTNDNGFNIQIAPYVRSSETHFRPDDIGDLMFNGIASDVQYTDFVTGLQNDNSWRVNSAHTIRAGFTVQNDHVQSNTSSLSFMTDTGGTPLVDGGGNNIISSPIIDNHTKDGQLYGTYLQDEWKLTDAFTMNYGARFDDMEQYVSANQLSPRLGFVYKATDTTTFHAGYARYFTPPPMELISNTDIAQFNDTTAALPPGTANSPVKPERSHNFDVGASQKLGDNWQFGIDGYYKLVQDLLDEGQFGAAPILTPFNYARGYIYGSELTATYTGDRLKAYGNFAFSRAMGEDVVSAQFNFDPTELSYINNHYVHLDHDQTFTASAGASYDVLNDTTIGLDGHFGSGLRDGFANTSHLPAYVTFDGSVEQKLDAKGNTAVRLSIVNIFDTAYELRNGTGIGVGAPQWGARRGVFAELAQKF